MLDTNGWLLLGEFPCDWAACVTQAGLIKDIAIRVIKEKRELKSKCILNHKSLAHVFLTQLETTRERLLRDGLWSSSRLRGESWQITFILGFQRLVIKAVSVEGLLNNASFITVMKVISQTRLPVCAALSCFIWTVSLLFHLIAH